MLTIKVYKNESLLGMRDIVNVTEETGSGTYGKGMQVYRVFEDGMPIGTIAHPFEDGFWKLAARASNIDKPYEIAGSTPKNKKRANVA